MSVKNWIAALIVGGATLAGGCKHSSHDPQAFLPKGTQASCANDTCGADACGTKRTGKRYFAPIPCCKPSTTCATQPILPPDAPRTLPSTSAKVPGTTTGKILPDDPPPVQPVPSRIPDALRDAKIEAPRTQSNYEPPIAEPSYVIPPVTEPTYIQPPVEPLKPMTTASEQAKVMPPASAAFAPVQGRAADYSSLTGRLEYSNIKRQWRLRYAAPDGDDEYGGIVSLQGLENSAMTPVEGATVHVKGQLVKPDGKTGSPEYFVHELNLAGAQ